MIYLTGATNAADEPDLAAAGIGLMIQPGNSYHLRIDAYPWWAADNGCFAARWDEDRWMRWLEAVPSRDRCLFAVAPDVYPSATATLERSLPFFPIIRELGYPVALVAQDGAELLDLPWEDFDALFLGGEAKHPEWKTSIEAERLARRARSLGKWVHMGRVNSLGRLDRARQMGCNSADGTRLKYQRRRQAIDSGEERLGRGVTELAAWSDWLASTPVLPFHPDETPALEVHKDALLRSASRPRSRG